VSDKNNAPDTTASALGPFTQMAAAIDAAEHAHFMRRLSSGKIEGWGTVTYGRSTPFAFPDNVTPVAAIVSPPRPVRLYGAGSIEATAASASGDVERRYCYTCDMDVSKACGDKECGVEVRAAQPVQAGEVVDLLESMELAAIWIESITPEQLELWRESKVTEIRRDIRKARASLAPVSAQQGAAEAAEKPGQWGYNVLTERMEPRENGGFYLAREADKWAAHPAPAAQAVDARNCAHPECAMLAVPGLQFCQSCLDRFGGRVASPASAPEAMKFEHQPCNCGMALRAECLKVGCDAATYMAAGRAAHALQPAAAGAVRDLAKRLESMGVAKFSFTPGSDPNVTPDQIAAEISRALDQLAAPAPAGGDVAKNATRYEFLREGMGGIYITTGDLAGNGDCDPVPAGLAGEVADCAIDAAMSAHQAKNPEGA
jgi:hypothetical protein